MFLTDVRFWYGGILSWILIVYETNASTENVLHLSKRQEYEDYRVCAQNFEIHKDKIIRTEESKRMGANYLNGKDVASKDECVKFCCETANCNVFVLEEKVFNQQSGTCYLFECGTPENFKCKFTRHHNYSSAVLIINRPQVEVLEDEIQYTQHERELTNLRVVENATKPKNCHHTTKANIINEEINRITDTKEIIKPENQLNSVKKSSRCSRYQFECRTSGECIAIYNACDGIPQCADHSDEDPELGCPTNAPIMIPKKLVEEMQPNDKHASGDNSEGFAERPRLQESNVAKIQPEGPAQEQVKTQINDQTVINRGSLNRQYKMNQWQSRVNQQGYNNVNQNELQNYPGANVNIDPRMILPQHQSSVANFGREGELMENTPWAGKNTETRIFKQNYAPLHNFNHKQNEISIPYNYGEYGNNGINQPYEKYNGNGYQGGNYYQPNVNQWHPRLPVSNYEPERVFPEQKNIETPRTRVAPEYFYEDPKTQTKLVEPVIENISPKTIYNTTANTAKEKKPQTTLQSTTNTTKTTMQTVKETSPIETTTAKAKNEHENSSIKQVAEDLSAEKNSHRKLEKQLSAEVSDAREQYVVDGYTEQPNGAFISLTLGLCVTAVMVFVVGCRLKVVRRRIRRGGKAPYAHDADFLVNGMYL